MNYLEQIIESLDKEDRSQFQSFIQRHRQKKNRKDLELFNLLAQGIKDTSDIKNGLQVKDLNSYHTIRKRLFLHISDFILLKSKDQDVTASARVNSLYTISKFLFEKGLAPAAWKLLLRAEKLGRKNELFDLVNATLLLGIEQCHLQEDVPLDWLAKRYEANNLRLKQTEKIILIQAVLKQRVLKSKKEGKEIYFEDIFSKTLTDFKMIRLSRESPKILFSLLTTLRQWVIASKEFHAFEPTIERSLKALENKDNHYYMVQILLMLAHTKYRNKRFQDSISCINTLEAHIALTPISFQGSMKAKVLQLKAANLIFLGQLTNSIALLNELLSTRLNERDKSNVIINLGIYHFYQHNYAECLKLLNSFEHTETWYKNHMGMEWLLKRDLMTILLYNDAGDKDLAESKIRSIERKYTHLFEQDRYMRVKTFLSIIKQVVYNEDLLDMQQLEKRVQVSFEWVPYEEKDLQAMMFYAWLRGKIIGGTFHESIVDLVSSDNNKRNYRLSKR